MVPLPHSVLLLVLVVPSPPRLGPDPDPVFLREKDASDLETFHRGPLERFVNRGVKMGGQKVDNSKSR